MPRASRHGGNVPVALSLSAVLQSAEQPWIAFPGSVWFPSMPSLGLASPTIEEPADRGKPNPPLSPPAFAPFCRVVFFPKRPLLIKNDWQKTVQKGATVFKKKKTKQDLHCTPLGSLQWWVGHHQLRACWDVGLSGIREGSALCRPVERGRKGKSRLPRSFGAFST